MSQQSSSASGEEDETNLVAQMRLAGKRRVRERLARVAANGQGQSVLWSSWDCSMSGEVGWG